MIKILNFANVNVLKVPCFRNSFYPFSFQLKDKLYELEPDLVHLRGLWRQGSLVALRWKIKNPTKKLIVQPAGMLEPWARRRKKIQKLFFYRLAESRLFEICDSVHATSAAESRNLMDMGIPAHKIFIIEEGIFMPPQAQSLSSTHSSVKTLLFLSRIHPKKGIELLLDVLALCVQLDGNVALLEWALKSMCRHLRPNQDHFILMSLFLMALYMD